MCFFQKKKILERQRKLEERINELTLIAMNIRDSVNSSISTTIYSVVNSSSNIMMNGVNSTLDRFSENVESVMNNNSLQLSDLKQTLDRNLTEMRRDNEKRLTEMREVVEEKLASTLNERLSRTFLAINERLDEVNKGLGEMRTLSGGVTDLKKMLSNVKTRGVFGEIGLDNILSNILTEEQYKKQFNLSGRTDDGRRVVDFAVIMPGQKQDERVFLPIDAKFPLEDYQRLVAASETGNVVAIAENTKALENAIKTQAKSIKENYIVPPKTVDFALMYLPIEGLYAEVVRNAGLLEELRNKFKVIPVGPTTITALLNSLQIGFKTLAVQKSGKEIYDSLMRFKSDFRKFMEVLEKAQGQISTVGRTLDDATKRTQSIMEKLDKAERLEPGNSESF